MKLLFAKIPDRDKSPRDSFTLDNISTNEFLEKYELLFDDISGYCYTSPFSQKEIMSSDCIFNIKKYFNHDVDILKDVTVAFFTDTSKGTMLQGWYKDADIYKYCQAITPLGGYYYYIRAKSTNAVLLPIGSKIDLELEFDDFIVPTEAQAKNIMDFISSYSGNKLNLVIEEALKDTIIPKISDPQQCIKEGNAIKNTNKLAPADAFRIIKMCQETINEYGENQDIYGLLADAYEWLGQNELVVKYERLIFEANPTYNNRLNYANSLYFSVDYEQSIPIYNELMEEKPSDLIRVRLAGLYHYKNHLLAAYQLCEQIKEEEYLSRKQIIMDEIKKCLPNAPRVKGYRRDGHVIKMSDDICYLPINQMPLPKEQNLNGKTYYLDPIRSRPIPKTPEEEIRQKTIRYLMDQLNIPKENILVEESLNHLEKSLKDRIDIIVFCLENGIKKKLLIIECKEPRVSVVGEPIEQLLRYNFLSPAKYLMITNGNDSLIYSSTSSEDEFISCSKLPDFQAMHRDIINTPILPELWERPERALLETPEYLENAFYNGTIGEDSTKNIRVLALNMHYCLVDPSEIFPSKIHGLLCQVVEDHGLTYRTVGNPSGGRFELSFRWLEVLDRKGNSNNIYIAIAGINKTTDDPVFGNSKGATIIMVAVEHKGKAVSMLQVPLDTQARQNSSSFTITHTGRRSRRTNQSTLDYVAKYCPQLFKNGIVHLGTLDNSKNFSLSGAQEQEFFLRLIDYTLLRYELWLQDRVK